MPTKDELEQENVALRAENERLREAASKAATMPNTRPVPTQPSFGISAGTAADIEQAEQRVRAGDVKEIKVVEPFTGSVVATVTADSVDAEESEEDYDDYDTRTYADE